MTTTFPIGPIVTPTKKEQIAEAIRVAILSGKFKPGQRIVETQVAREVGIGNTAVREALFELEARGFITRIANKGTFVTDLTVEDAEQIFRARRAMEGLAAELLVERATAADLDSLEACARRMESAVLCKNIEDFCKNDIEFHSTIWRLSGNRFLASALETMVLPLFAFFRMMCPPGSEHILFESVERHTGIVEAFRQRREPRKCMEQALDSFCRDKLKLLYNLDP